MQPTTVYDLNMQPKAYLENANHGYKKKFNKLWEDKLILPADDPKNAECQPFRFVRTYDGEEEVGLFRIMQTTVKRTSSGKVREYTLEHVLGTLLDDIIFQYHENDNLTTRENIEYVLGFQKTQRWVLGQCDFERFFSYKYENNKIYNALKAIPEVLDGEYLWTWDTSVFPWVLNLISPSADLTGRILYGHNQNGITRQGDPRDCVTRMYALGYGEGVNQLTIESANPTGLPYIDADTQNQFGIIEDIIADRRFENAESLFAYTQAELEKVKIPPVSYTCGAADVYPITGSEVDRLDLGKMIRIQDDDLGLNYNGRIITYGKPDVNGAPGKVNVEIARRPKDITDAQNDLRDRQRVNEVNAQGATNIYAYSYDDNCDENFPAVIRFYMPPETVHENKIYVSFQTDKFRGYVKSMKSAGQVVKTVTSGPSSTSTTAAGGGKTSGPSSTSTTASGGGDTSAAGGDHRHIVLEGVGYTDASNVPNLSNGTYTYMEFFNSVGVYFPGEIPAGATYKTSGASGDHTHGLPLHTHGMDHYHTLPDHEHGMDHNHPIEIDIPGHTHEQIFGIWEAPDLPNSITLEVDGTKVPNVNLSEDNFDIKPYLSKDAGGKTQVGVTHEIKIQPDSLARISANVFVQIFIQSRI